MEEFLDLTSQYHHAQIVYDGQPWMDERFLVLRGKIEDAFNDMVDSRIEDMILSPE
tara:strand:+ start:2480 stop:2647 length:168 start_codon:yes stop_codon:yes gene_type:complete